MIVESGLARCPRCVSVADYVFIESRSGREYRGLRYEVRCRKCGEHYGEDSRPVPRHPVVVAEPPIEWPPDREPVEPVDWRAELNRRLSAASQGIRRLSVASHRRLSSEIGVVAGRAQAFAPKRLLERGSRQGDQTGG